MTASCNVLGGTLEIQVTVTNAVFRVIVVPVHLSAKAVLRGLTFMRTHLLVYSTAPVKPSITTPTPLASNVNIRVPLVTEMPVTV